jgi:hypothetical protein
MSNRQPPAQQQQRLEGDVVAKAVATPPKDTASWILAVRGVNDVTNAKNRPYSRFGHYKPPPPSLPSDSSPPSQPPESLNPLNPITSIKPSHEGMGVKERLTNDGNVGVGKALDKRVVLNVGGTRHETWISTLETLPGSRLALLAHLQESDEAFDLTTGEYFFDRHPKAFEIIIHYFRTNELHVDQSVCGNVLKGVRQTHQSLVSLIGGNYKV